MKKIGSLKFYEDIDLNLNFTFEDLMEDFDKTSEGVKEEFLDDDNNIKFKIVDKYVKEYVNKRIRKKYGKNYSLDVMDDVMNISWDIKVKTVKRKHHEKWWDKEK